MKRRVRLPREAFHRGVYASLVLYSLLIATSFPVGEAVANIVSPTVLTFLRFVCAAVVFLLILLVRRELSWPACRILAKCALLAVFMATFFCLMFEALQTASALNTGAIFTFSPLLSLCFGLVVNRVTGSARQIVSLLVGAAGATWVVFDGDLEALGAFRLGHGERLFLLGTVCFSLYSPFAKRFISRENAALATFWVLVFSAVFTGLFSLFRDGPSAFREVPPEVWIAILYLAIFPTAITFFVSTRASTMISPFKVTSFVYLVPACVALIELVVYGRTVSASVVCGIAVTAVATLLVQVSSPDARKRTIADQ